MFEMKRWLDENVVPLTKQDPPLKIYSFIWNGDPPQEILVWLLTCEPWQAEAIPLGSEKAREEEATAEELAMLLHRDADGHKLPFDPTAWTRAVHRLILDGWKFDLLREQQMVQLESGLVPVFGGDGAPIFGKEGTASVRLLKKMDDGIALILQIGCHYPGEPGYSPGQEAAAAVKALFALFDENALQVCQKYGAQFGTA